MSERWTLFAKSGYALAARMDRFRPDQAKRLTQKLTRALSSDTITLERRDLFQSHALGSAKEGPISQTIQQGVVVMSQTRVSEMPASPHNERLDLSLIASAQLQDDLIWIDPERLSGAPCFAGTRVPVKHLWDYLEGGESLDEFLEGFPGVTREQAIGVLEMAFREFLEGFPQR